MDPKKDSVKSANPTPSLDSFLMLKAMSPSTLVSCAKQNVAFFNCKKNKGEDPEACLEQAMDVRRCTLDTIASVMDPKNGCDGVFFTYSSCMYRTRGDFTKCHDERSAFEACASKNMGINFKQPVKAYTDISDL